MVKTRIEVFLFFLIFCVSYRISSQKMGFPTKSLKASCLLHFRHSLSSFEQARTHSDEFFQNWDESAISLIHIYDTDPKNEGMLSFPVRISLTVEELLWEVCAAKYLVGTTS